MRNTSRAVRLRVGGNVRRLRLDRGWTQERLAELVGKTEKHLSLVELGKANVGLDTLSALAKRLSVDASAFFSPAPPASDVRAAALSPEDVDLVTRALRAVLSARGRRRARSMR